MIGVLRVANKEILLAPEQVLINAAWFPGTKVGRIVTLSDAARKVCYEVVEIREDALLCSKVADSSEDWIKLTVDPDSPKKKVV